MRGQVEHIEHIDFEPRYIEAIAKVADILADNLSVQFEKMRLIAAIGGSRIPDFMKHFSSIAKIDAFKKAFIEYLHISNKKFREQFCFIDNQEKSVTEWMLDDVDPLNVNKLLQILDVANDQSVVDVEGINSSMVTRNGITKVRCLFAINYFAMGSTDEAWQKLRNLIFVEILYYLTFESLNQDRLQGANLIGELTCVLPQGLFQKFLKLIGDTESAVAHWSNADDGKAPDTAIQEIRNDIATDAEMYPKGERFAAQKIQLGSTRIIEGMQLTAETFVGCNAAKLEEIIRHALDVELFKELFGIK